MRSKIKVPTSKTVALPNLLEKYRGTFATLFFTFLFFLCSADMFFAVRLHDFNFRFGQALLLIGSLAVLTPFILRGPLKWFEAEPYFRSFLNWLPFFLVYALSASLSLDPAHSYLKWGWAAFNMGGAAVICLHRGSWAPLKNGLFYGILTIAFFIWVEFVAIYWFGGMTSVPESPTEGPFVLWNGLFVGYAQSGGHMGDVRIFRPHGFFYEPSYAGCALSFAFPLCLALWIDEKSSFWRSTFAPAFILVAAWMTSSRSAIFGTLFSLFIVFIGGLALRQTDLLKKVSKVVLTAVILFGLLAISSPARSYVDFFLNITAPHGMAERVVDPSSSEGWRMANVIHSLELWRNHPLLGMGVPSPSADKGLHGLGQTSESMWLEVGVETGTLGFLAYAFGLLKTAADAARDAKSKVVLLLVAAALAAHMVISMNLTSTFPRLDYWILYFFTIRLLLETKKNDT